METLETIRELYKKAVCCGLRGVDGFLSEFTEERLMLEYNGIGPEWMPATVRERVSAHLALFAPAALIHDLRNYRSDGSTGAFHDANEEFLFNCRALAKAAYPWWSWRRYRALGVASVLFDFVEGPGGWYAWRVCYYRKTTKSSTPPTEPQRH